MGNASARQACGERAGILQRIMQMTLCKAQGSSPQQGTLRAFRRQLPLCEKLGSLLELRQLGPFAEGTLLP